MANANSRDPFQIADEIGLQIQMVKDFTVLKGVYMILHEVPWAFINDNLDDRMKRIVCAHEIGHHLLHQDLVRQTMLQEFSLFDRKNRPEYEANVIAAEILLPDTEVLGMIYDCGYDACSICFITQNVASRNFHFRKQIDGDTGIKDVSAGKQKVDGISQCIHNSMDFCSLSTVTYTDKLVVFRIYSPLFAPALCGCALMLVLSIHRFS